jgi:branched-chain amino acid transport system permease protein
VVQYALALLTFVAIYGMISLGLNLQWGLTGLVNLGQVAFFSVGAYASALLLLAGMPFVLALVAAALLPAGLAVLVALVTPRLREDYLAIVTLGFAEIVRLVFLNEKWIAGGPDGLTAIPDPFAGLPPDQHAVLYMLATLAGLVLFLLVNIRITHLPIGRVLKAIRTDETLVASLGKNVLAYKVQMLALGAAMAGVAGAFYASYLTYIAPAMFTAQVSLNVLVAVLIGGQGSSGGVLVGTVIVTLILEGTRFLKDYMSIVGDAELAALRMIAVGAALIAIVLVRYRRGRPA